MSDTEKLVKLADGVYVRPSDVQAITPKHTTPGGPVELGACIVAVRYMGLLPLGITAATAAARINGEPETTFPKLA